MNKIIPASIAIIIGVSTLAFAADLSHASEGRLSINMIGTTVAQTVQESGQRYAETFVVQSDHTLKLVDKTPITNQ